MDRIITGRASRSLLYEQLQNILGMLDRILPMGEDDTCDTREVLAEFSPGRNAVIEAEHAGICSLQIDPRHWRFEGVIPSTHTSPSSKRWFLKRVTQHASVWDDCILHGHNTQALSLPHGMRLWHENEGIRKALILTKHDLNEIFTSISEGRGGSEGVPHVRESDAYGGGMTLLATPRRILGFDQGLHMLREQCPYVTYTCQEYAKIICYLYGLSMKEFRTVTRMSISRRLGGTPIALQDCGGGLYDNGPWISALIGMPYVTHDLSPTLVNQSHDQTHGPCPPLRVRVAEGTLTVLDGYARTCYAHGYAHEPQKGSTKGSPFYYTIDFFMDSMRTTELIAYAPWTGEMIMQTPVVAQHAVERTPHTRPAKEAGLLVTGGCALLDTVRTIRARLQDAESKHLLHHARKRRVEPEVP